MHLSRILLVFFALFSINFSLFAQETIPYEHVAEYDVGTVLDMLILLDGTYVVASDSGLWTLNPNEAAIQQWETPAAIRRMFLYNDYEVLLAYEDNSIGIWDVANGTELKRFSGHNGAINKVIVIPGGEFFVTGSADGTVRLWNVASGSEEAVILETDSPILDFAYDFTSGTIASLSEDNAVHIWLMPSRRELGVLNFESVVRSIAFTFYNQDLRMLVGMEDSLHVWDIVTSASFEYEGQAYPLYEVPLESGSQNLALVETGRSQSAFIDPANPSAENIIWDGNWRSLVPALASIEDSSEVEVLGAHNGAILTILEHPRLLVSVGEDGTVYGWIGDLEEFYHLELSPDSEFIFMNDDVNLVFASVNEDNSVSVWATEFGIEYASLAAQTAKTTHIASTSIASSTIVSATEDGILHLWQAPRPE